MNISRFEKGANRCHPQNSKGKSRLNGRLRDTAIGLAGAALTYAAVSLLQQAGWSARLEVLPKAPETIAALAFMVFSLIPTMLRESTVNGQKGEGQEAPLSFRWEANILVVYFGYVLAIFALSGFSPGLGGGLLASIWWPAILLFAVCFLRPSRGFSPVSSGAGPSLPERVGDVSVREARSVTRRSAKVTRRLRSSSGAPKLH